MKKFRRTWEKGEGRQTEYWIKIGSVGMFVTLSSKHLDKWRVLRMVSKRLMQGDVNDDM